MIYSVNFMDLTEQINPHAFVKYLKDTGWNAFYTRKTYVKIFQITNDKGESFQVTIPMEKTLSDYKSAMYYALETVALFEGQSTEQLLLYLLNPNTDILKIRLERKDIECGSIFLDDAIHIYENAKRLIAAAAQDVLHPRRYHLGRMDDSISKFISNCKFGQTEVGSYVVSVVCPFAELDDAAGYRQLSIFSDEEQCANSLTRKVTNKIMTNVSLIKHNIDEGNFDELVSEDTANFISANFYEALTGLNLDVNGANVEFIAQWSPVVKKNRCSSNHVLLSHDYCQPISSAVEKLRRTSDTKTKILGRIKKLESVPDVSKRTIGQITVVYLDKNDKRKTVTAVLSKDDYDRAIDAHSKGNHVEIIGDIKNVGAKNQSISCESFSIIE